MQFHQIALDASVPMNELFRKLSDGSEQAIKGRGKLFGELRTELERHAALEEQHLFPVLMTHKGPVDLVAAARKDHVDMRAKLAELERLPKDNEGFVARVSDLKKTFRQHARDEKNNLLPFVEKALRQEEAKNAAIVEARLAETARAEAEAEAAKRAEQVKHERERAALEVQHAQVAARAATEQADAEAALQTAAVLADATVRTAATVGREVVGATAGAVHAVASATSPQVRQASRAPAPVSTGFFFWDMMLGMQPSRQSRAVQGSATAVRALLTAEVEQVIPLAEETLVVGKRVVSSGTTRVRRFVVETPVEQHVSLFHERVVVERRRPVVSAATGERFSGLTIESTETYEVPVVSKSVHLTEEIVVRKERTEHIETVRDVLRREEVEIVEQPSHRPTAPRQALV